MLDTKKAAKAKTDANKIDEISFQLPDISLAALACGNKEAPPVLCLHGYLDNAASFLPLMQDSDFLPNRRIIALDWPGHGHSAHRGVGAHYHFFDYVSDLVALFTVNNWQAIDIVAHSMGAMIASAFAAAFPEKVKSLTLIDCFGFICAPAENTTHQLRKGILSQVRAVIASRAFTEEIAVKARMQVSDLSFDHAKLIVKRSLIAVEEKSKLADKAEANTKAKSALLYRWRSDPRLRTVSSYRLTLAQAQQLFSDVKCPLQLIYGDKGMEMVVTGLKNFSAKANNLTTTKLAGGHHVHMEQTQALSTLLSHFYSKIQTSV